MKALILSVLHTFYHTLNHLNMKILKFSWVLLFAFLFSCGGNDGPLQEVKPEFSKYVIGYTKGDYLSDSARFMLRLRKSPNDSIKPGQKVNVDLFEFSPAVEGEAYWVDNQTIEFVPKEFLESNTVYKVIIKVGKIMDVPKEFEEMEYEIKTIEQSMRLSEGLLNSYPDEMRFLRYENDIITADIANNEKIEKTISATFDGKDYIIKWNHDIGGKIHSFYIDSIPRKKTGKMLSIKVDAAIINAAEVETSELRIPGIDEFEVLSVTPQMGDNQSITIRFSDPLLRDQDVDGLITLVSREKLSLTISGNMIIATPSVKLKGKKIVKISKAIKNALSYKLKNDQTYELVFESLKPNVKLVGDGTIMPSGDGLIFPFEAVNLRAVDMRIIQIYEDNVLFFLQENNFANQNNITRVGRLITQKRINLLDGKIDPGKWNTFKVDISKMIEPQPGAIYRVELRFRKEYSLYSCDGSPIEEIKISDEDYEQEVKAAMAKYDGRSYYYDWDYEYDDYYYDDDYDWHERENPCSSSYYVYGNDVGKNILVSDLGIVAKGSPTGQYFIAVSDIKTTKPISGAEVTLYNYQRQPLNSGTTDGNGFYKTTLKDKPFFVVVKNNNQKGYLKISNADALSLSNFNVSGVVMQDGMKGFIYGERGVWRPGDEMFITFILEDKYQQLPKQYPVKFSLYNPSNQLIQTQTVKYGENGFYHFHTQTADDAITGDWLLKVQAGGAIFSRNIKVEAIKPNRIRASIGFNKDIITKEDLSRSFRLTAQWLHGSPAGDLKFDIKLKHRKMKTSFKNFSTYNFDDVTSKFDYDEKDLSSGTLNDEGWKDLSLDFSNDKAPGFLNTTLTTRIFEKSGDFSIMTQSLTYSQYDYYIGASIITNSDRGWYDIRKKHTLSVAAVDPDGKPKANRNVSVHIYKVGWRWWWQSYNDLANYMNSRSTIKVLTFNAKTGANGKVNVNFKIPYTNHYDNGRYLILVEDDDGEHRSSFTTYFSEWYGRVGDIGEGATILAISSDKDEYKVGEEAEIIIPSSAGGVALVSIEKGSEIVDNFRVETTANETRFKLKINGGMAPGVYVHITMLQPHSQTINDNPIRMYGVIPLDVIDPETKLRPVIKVNSSLEPEKKFTVNIKEENGKAMTYTLAIVDEGLLDITGFRTPDPWPRFYSREALMVRTWDMYDYVIGAYGARLEKALAIGGGDKILDPSKSKTQRFKPVVLFSGPHTIAKGENKTHEFTMPNYVGSVRVMVVAGDKGAYGNAEKAVPVKKDLMILSTMPRVLGPEEEVQLPVTVFAMDAKVKTVKITISTNGLLSATQTKTQTITFDKIGEKIVYFPLKVASATGQAKLHIEASGGGMKAVNDVEIEVRNPNLPQTIIRDTVLEPGKKWKYSFKAFGIKGTNSSSVEIATMVPINLSKRLDYLIHYPYGCIEQTVSSVFPQLFLENIVNLTAEQKVNIQNNITSALNRLRAFQLPNGSFSYWPGQDKTNNWGTNYAGHFLIEAKAKGYNLPSGMLKAWISYQSSKANQWDRYDNYSSDLEQAYRLFLLAKVQKPETSAMNRLRELDKITFRAKTLLSGAYALNNQMIAAVKLLEKPVVSVNNRGYYYDYTYGSNNRDDALHLIILNLLNRKTEAFIKLQEIAKDLNEDRWMSTQTTAFCLMAVADYFKSGNNENMKADINIDGTKKQVNTNLSINMDEIKVDDMKSHYFEVKNTSTKAMYVKLNLTGTPAGMAEIAVNDNLKIDVSYVDMAGDKINPEKIKQGTDFKVILTIWNPGYRDYYYDMSLSQIFPSGWEIINSRLFSIGESTGFKPEYQDIRDDRVYSFYTIRRNTSITLTLMLNAAYAGRYYLPAIHCGAMYDNTIKAVVPGQWVEVVRE